MPTNTIKLHRVFRTTPKKIYRAFLDPEALPKWYPPNGFTCKVLHMDAKVGGSYKMSFTNFTNEKTHFFGGNYKELSPGKKLYYSTKFEDPGMPGEMHTSITLNKVSCGTEINIVQEGIPANIPPENCYLGWQECLILLAKLVEPEIHDVV